MIYYIFVAQSPRFTCLFVCMPTCCSGISRHSYPRSKSFLISCSLCIKAENRQKHRQTDRRIDGRTGKDICKQNNTEEKKRSNRERKREKERERKIQEDRQIPGVTSQPTCAQRLIREIQPRNTIRIRGIFPLRVFIFDFYLCLSTIYIHHLFPYL